MRLAALWREQPLGRVLSSPFARCVQTVQPLAKTLGLPVDPTADLAEGHADDALQLVHSLVAEDAALCTHGDIIPSVLQALDREGMAVAAQWQWRKGSTWVLHAQDGSFTRATYVPCPV